nr:unnamed protein product [Callosobruchus analis]
MEVDTQSSDVLSEERKLNLAMGRLISSTPPGEEIVISGQFAVDTVRGFSFN